MGGREWWEGGAVGRGRRIAQEGGLGGRHRKERWEEGAEGRGGREAQGGVAGGYCRRDTQEGGVGALGIFLVD